MVTLFPEVPVKVKTPLILKVFPSVNCKALLAVVTVKLLKVMAGDPEPVRTEVLVASLKTTVPELWLKVALLVKLPPMVKVAGAVKIPEEIVRLPFMVKEARPLLVVAALARLEISEDVNILL